MLTDVELNLLRDSYELAIERDDDFPRLFYDILFYRHPEVEQLFVRNTLNAQRLMVGQTLVAIVEHLDNDAWLAEHVRSLGRGHVEYGVTPEMYDWMGEAMIEAVAERCGADWTPAHDRAWRAGYARIVEVMRAGEQDA
jgi:hemoglobin-like flavoprotein